MLLLLAVVRAKCFMCILLQAVFAVMLTRCQSASHGCRLRTPFCRLQLLARNKRKGKCVYVHIAYLLPLLVNANAECCCL